MHVISSIPGRGLSREELIFGVVVALPPTWGSFSPSPLYSLRPSRVARRWLRLFC